MKSKPRWMKRVIKTAKTEADMLPLTRLKATRQLMPQKADMRISAGCCARYPARHRFP